MNAETTAKTGVWALIACVLGYPTFGIGFLAAAILGAQAVRSAMPKLRTTEGEELALYRRGFYAGTLAATLGVFLPTMTVGIYVFWDALIWWK